MVRNLTIIGATSVLVVIGFVVGFAIVASSKNKNKESEAVCFTEACFHTASKVLKNINKEVNPCDNFYEFACGGYLANAPIPDEKISIDIFAEVRDEIQKQLKSSIERPSEDHEPRSFAMAKNMYRACMNTTAIEKTGLEPIHKILKQIGGWPVLDGANWKGDEFSWMKSVYNSRRLGLLTNYFIKLGSTVDWRNNTKWMLSLDQASLGLPAEILSQFVESYKVKAYYNYMVDVAVLLGANRPKAAYELMEALKFEVKLAAISEPEENRRNFTLLNNPMSIKELGKQHPSINWVEYINNLLSSTVRVDTDEVITVREPGFVIGLERLIKDTPKNVQANYVGWRIVADSIEYLPEKLRARQLEFLESLRGVKEGNVPRWSECLSIIYKTPLSISINALYVRQYFKEDARQTAVEMVGDIRNELAKILEKAEWMDENTRSKAMEKAASIITHVAYPVELLDDKQLEELFSPVELSPNDFFGNSLNLTRFDMEFVLKKLRQPVNKTEWATHEHSAEVNAMYDPTENSVQIPAGILQGVFFSNDRPRYMNYGAIGSLIGHELTHSFDNEGRQFDKDGNLVDWWTPETAEKYLEKSQCIIDQYNNYTVPAVGLNVDGKNTLGENIADNGGIKEAYFAYKEYVKRNGPEQKLPGLNYTSEQMYWISASNVWCAKWRPDAAKYELTTDVHSPERFRVIGSFSNVPEFSADFNCPLGSTMNPKHKCSVL